MPSKTKLKNAAITARTAALPQIAKAAWRSGLVTATLSLGENLLRTLSYTWT